MYERSTTVALLSAVLFTAAAQPAAALQDTNANSSSALASLLEPSLVRVEVTLQFDKGQPPAGAGLTEQCPNCGRFHVQRGGEYVEQERPFEFGGFLLSPTRVIVPDLTTHPRFVVGIEVVQGDTRVTATPVAYARTQNAMILELDAPLTNGKPLMFVGDTSGPYKTIGYSLLNGSWTITTTPLSLDSIVSQNNHSFTIAPNYSLIVTEHGQPVAMTMTGEIPLDDTWKQSPEHWQWLSADEYNDLLTRVEQISDRSVLHTRIDLRSPKASPQSNPYAYMADDEQATELHLMSILIDDQTILVLSELRPKVTARLESITVFPVGSEPIQATFQHSLQDYGALLATLETPITGGATLSDHSITDFQHALLGSANIRMQSEDRVAYYNYARIGGYEIGWRRHLYPNIPGESSNLFVFDENGAILILPIARRDWSGENEYWGGGSDAQLTAATQIKQVLSDITQHIDESNVPLSEAEESRVAWTGVIMQELDEELARAYEVSELSENGYIGGIVSFIYPDSPAENAGIENGDILLRVHVERLPRPLDITAETNFGMNFPWERLDEVPEEYFDQIPRPWPSVDNAFNRLLTGLGFGTECTIELFRDGEIVHIPLTVIESPLHHDAAPQFKSEQVGITTKPLTYELRRYFQKSEDDPGIIVSRIEPGSKASVSGIKPYEIVLEVNGQPVHTNDDFQAAILNQSELRLTIDRMRHSRIVKLVFDEPITNEDQTDDAEDEIDHAATAEDAEDANE